MLKTRKSLLTTACSLALTTTLCSLSLTATHAEERVRWKIPTVFGTHLPGLGDPIKLVTEQIGAASNKSVQFKVYEPGKLVPPFGITEAVKNNQVPAAYAWLGYDLGKIPASALLSAVPFGMEPWAYAAWWYDDEGKKLAEDLYAKHNAHPVLCSVIGPETAGWFKQEIKTLDDIKGLKIRFAGLGGKVLQELGASVTVIPGGEIFPALEKGAIDASEFSMPAVDQLMGFDKVAKYNYFPGWHQTFTASHLLVNKQVWEKLPSDRKALIDMACTAGTFRALTRGEAIQGDIIAGFPAKGVKATRMPDELLKGLKKASDKVLNDLAASDADFKRIYESQQAFAAKYKKWKTLAYLPDDL